MRVSLLFIFLTSVFGFACSTSPVRSTVDSYGETPIQKDRQHYFVKEGLSLIEKQSSDSCEQAAMDSQIAVVKEDCPKCIRVLLKMQLAGTEQVIQTSPGFGTGWGYYGRRGGIGFGASDVRSYPEAGREIDLLFLENGKDKEPLREVQIRSLGRENSVTAVAYEMCKAAFQDYPRDLKGKSYEIDSKPKD